MIGDKDLALPGKMLDFHATQHKLIAHNVANAGIEDFKRLSVKFSDELSRAIDSGDPDRISQAKFTVEKAKQPGVDSDMEVATLAKNEQLFTTFAEIASFRLRMLKLAVTSK